MTRRRFIKTGLNSVLSLLGISVAGLGYAKYIEPRLFTVRSETITSPRIAQPLDGFRILQFSDLHIGFHLDEERLEAIVSRINNYNVDMIVFTGDLFDDPSNLFHHTYERVASLLNSMKAPYGKFWIYGNHDHGGYGTEEVKSLMDRAGFTLLQNSSTLIKINEEELLLVGLDDALLGEPNLDLALQNQDQRPFTLLLCHEPDLADSVQHYPVDVMLAGHSHGGQIRLPFVGPLVTPPLAYTYTEGLYSIGTTGFQLYVSRGLGMTRLPYRFLCRPELTIHTLNYRDRLNS
ncbi:metallophosphoesterase [Pontibacillus halophilus JSM 076056 = DSM 19796]|uniref:Metallophosphoesterase n=2 Tax=Pontibacillus TaxID=289201 RepID=A0A0A5GED8_9BACI|nr:metallophosphoesterase [Pontibacillus halophilus]KGX91576.1 metallophosphoesterase [Pontibacillus halophilus JSM 076056 = DSM 19796]